MSLRKLKENVWERKNAPQLRDGFQHPQHKQESRNPCPHSLSHPPPTTAEEKRFWIFPDSCKFRLSWVFTLSGAKGREVIVGWARKVPPRFPVEFDLQLYLEVGFAWRRRGSSPCPALTIVLTLSGVSCIYATSALDTRYPRI